MRTYGRRTRAPVRREATAEPDRRSTGGRLEQLHGVAGRVVGERLPSGVRADDPVAEGDAGPGQPGDLGIEIVDQELEAVPAAGCRWRAVRGTLPCSTGAGRVEEQPEIAAPQHREARSGMHDHLEPEQLVEVDRLRRVV